MDLFFDWGSDMILTLQRVDAVVARLQSEMPPTAKLETHRLTFAVFPIIGYSLTSDSVPQNRLWEIATYDLRLNGTPESTVFGAFEAAVKRGVAVRLVFNQDHDQPILVPAPPQIEQPGGRADLGIGAVVQQ